MAITIKKSLHLALLLSPALAQAAGWSIAPTVRIRQSYSDNANLSATTEAQGAWTTEITPAIAVNLDGGQRAQLALSYALHQVYAEQRADRRDHQLDASGHAQLLPGWLYLDARAGISRQNTSAFGPRLTDSAQAPLNSATVRTHSFSPYVQHVFPGLASVTLRYDGRRVDSDRLLRVNSDGASLRMAGDNGGRGWNWEAFVEHQILDDSAMAPVTTRNASLMLSYPLGSSIGTFVTSGYERRDYQGVASARVPEGRYHALGASWTPSPRTRLSASIGRRYFGKTYSFDAAYRMRNMVWNASYHEDITTMHAQFFSVPPAGLGDFLYQLWETRIPDPQKRRQSIQLFLLMSQMLGTDGNVNVFSHRYYLQKSSRLASVYSGARGALAFNLARTERVAQTSSAIDSVLTGPDALAREDHTRQSSAQLGWNWRLSARSGLNAGASHSRARSLSTARRDRNSVLAISFEHQLRPGLRADLNLRHSRHASNAGGDYRENGVSAAITMAF